MDCVRTEAPVFDRSDRDQALASWEDEGGSIHTHGPGCTRMTSLDIDVVLFLCRDLPPDMRLSFFGDLLSSFNLENR